MTKELKVDCPQCKKKVAWIESETFRPFCSERCRNIDLGAWANEEYAIPTSEPSEEWSETEFQMSEPRHTLQ